jgi:DNA-binding transcriptional LysR family regulator
MLPPVALPDWGFHRARKRHHERQEPALRVIRSRLLKMDFRHIDAFRALMLTRTTTKAAALLGLSQPAISRLIAELERSAQLTFFNRDKGRLDPTAEALAFFEEVKRRYAGLEGLREFAARLRSPAESVLHVGCVNTYSLGLFAKTAARFAAIEPSTKLTMTVGPSELVRDQVAAGSLSVGFVTDSVNTADLDAESFCAVDAIVGLPPTHRLATRTTIDIEELRNEPFIAYLPATMVRWGINQFFTESGVQPRVVAEVQYATNAVAMIRERLGIGLVHPIVAYEFREHKDIVFRRFRPTIKFSSLRIKPWVPAPSLVLQRFLTTSDEALEEVLAEVKKMLKE